MMKKSVLLLAALSTRAFCDEDVAEDNITETSGGMAIKFHGKSGKFSIYSEAVGRGDPNRVTFEIDEFREFDADGKEVEPKGGKGSTHSFKDFKKTQFNFTQEEDVTVGTATATKVAFKSDMNGLGEFYVDTYLITKDGEVGPDLDDPEAPKWDTGLGDVKFNIGIENWEWCTAETCATEGEYIEVDMEIKSKKKPEKKAGKGGGVGKKAGKAFDLGGGIPLDFSSELMVDGANATMPEGYPKLEQKGSKSIITFYFPKFQNKAVYDPLAGTGDSDSLEVDDGDNSAAGQPLLGLAGLIALFVATFH